MPIFTFKQISISASRDGRQIVRAVVQNQRNGQTLAIWEHVDNGRMQDSIYFTYRNTSFSSSLKRFLLSDVDAAAVSRLRENGGYEWRATERYAELMADLERRLSASLPAEAAGSQRAGSTPAKTWMRNR